MGMYSCPWANVADPRRRHRVHTTRKASIAPCPFVPQFFPCHPSNVSPRAESCPVVQRPSGKCFAPELIRVIRVRSRAVARSAPDPRPTTPSPPHETPRPPPHPRRPRPRVRRLRRVPWPVTDFPPLKPGPRTPEDITLKVDGPPGRPFTASLTLDGVPRELTGVTPAAFPLHCAVLTGQVTGDGPFHLELTRHNGHPLHRRAPHPRRRLHPLPLPRRQPGGPQHQLTPIRPSLSVPLNRPPGHRRRRVPRTSTKGNPHAVPPPDLAPRRRPRRRDAAHLPRRPRLSIARGTRDGPRRARHGPRRR